MIDKEKKNRIEYKIRNLIGPKYSRQDKINGMGEEKKKEFYNELL